MNNNCKGRVFDNAVALDGPHLVAASAGTGKTYSIQNIYARLVAERGLRVAEIQVMTFTEKATKELRDRLRKVLQLLYAYYNGEQVDDKERSRLEDLCRRVKVAEVSNEIARTRLEIALMEFDCAAISTIHGFSRRALARYAFETGAPFDAELTDSDSALLYRMARDWWRVARERPQNKPDLGLMTEYVVKLASHPDAKIVADENSPNGQMLAKAQEIVEAYHAARDSRRTRTFDELLLSLRDALRNDTAGKLAVHLRQEFKAVVVDEFQDTDPVQYEIFRRVFLDVPDGVVKPTLFFVGDPKQAIYSFRGGDIYTYAAAARRDDVSANTFCLGKNYRSTPRLIDAVNLFFKDFRSGDGKTDYTFGDATIDYSANLEADNTREAFQINGADDPQPFRVIHVKNHKTKENKEGLAISEGMNSAVVESVLSVLEEQRGKITPKDIAILVPSHTSGDILRNALRAKNVPVVLQHAGNVFGQPLAKEFLTLLQAMALEGGAGRVRAAMLSSFFDFTPGELDADAEGEGETLAQALAKFKELNRVWMKRGFDAAMAELENYDRCNFRSRFAAQPDGERKLADAIQLIDLSIRTVRQQGPSPEALIAWVADRIAKGYSNNFGAAGPEARSEEYARELESEHDAVKIMTMHVSKGLEFPVVIVPLPVSDKKNQNDKGPYGYHDDDGTFVYSTEITGKHHSEIIDERIRLLYVVMTRATKRTVLIVPENVPESWPVCRLLANAKRHLAQSGIDSEYSPIRENEDYQPKDQENYVPQQNRNQGSPKPEKRLHEFDLTPSKGSYSSLSPSERKDDDGRDWDGATETNSAAAATGNPKGKEHQVFALPGGLAVGTCWHSILEKIDFAADDDTVGTATLSALRMHGLPDDNADVVAEMMKATLSRRINAPDGETFSLREVKAADRFSEWEFDFSSRDAVATTAAIKTVIERYWGEDSEKRPFIRAMDGWNRLVPNGFLKGYLDLLFRHNGYYYVVDWKSNSINGCKSGFSKEGVTAEMAEHGYFFQYLLYATVLHRFLKENLKDKYFWERNFGGIRYYFLRGVAAGCESAVFADRPCEAMLEELAAAFGMENVK